ncbi:MAG: hypothetical protein RM021_013600 [Nostoc sp. EkiNYC01]|nr:hypothetical protein [Nostoc sp. EkiNYC01]
MFGTKDLPLKSEKINYISQQLKENPEEITPDQFLNRLLKQSKQLSQIIAYIWRWADADDVPQKKDYANKLKKYFANPTEDLNCPAGRLKKLLQANPNHSEEELTEEDKLLRAVFFEDTSSDNTGLVFPMFYGCELSVYSFQVNINSFEGMLRDATQNAPGILNFYIPYPPCPHFGNATVTEYELEEWIQNRDKKKTFADNPYIPTTSS